MTKQVIENGKLLFEFDTEEEKWLEEHVARRTRAYQKQYRKEVYANKMVDKDLRYQEIVKNIREVFLKEYRERWDKKWAAELEEAEQNV